jgi:hypothetical protein
VDPSQRWIWSETPTMPATECPGWGSDFKGSMTKHKFRVLWVNRTIQIHQIGTSGRTGGTLNSCYTVRSIVPRPPTSYLQRVRIVRVQPNPVHAEATVAEVEGMRPIGRKIERKLIIHRPALFVTFQFLRHRNPSAYFQIICAASATKWTAQFRRHTSRPWNRPRRGNDSHSVRKSEN